MRRIFKINYRLGPNFITRKSAISLGKAENLGLEQNQFDTVKICLYCFSELEAIPNHHRFCVKCVKRGEFLMEHLAYVTS